MAGIWVDMSLLLSVNTLSVCSRHPVMSWSKCSPPSWRSHWCPPRPRPHPHSSASQSHKVHFCHLLSTQRHFIVTHMLEMIFWQLNSRAVLKRQTESHTSCLTNGAVDLPSSEIVFFSLPLSFYSIVSWLIRNKLELMLAAFSCQWFSIHTFWRSGLHDLVVSVVCLPEAPPYMSWVFS